MKSLPDLKKNFYLNASLESPMFKPGHTFNL